MSLALFFFLLIALAITGFCGSKQNFYILSGIDCGHSLVAQTVKNLPAMQETWVPSLSQEDPLEKGKATHSSILAWRIPWVKEPGELQSMGLHSQT